VSVRMHSIQGEGAEDYAVKFEPGSLDHGVSQVCVARIKSILVKRDPFLI
jgi:hypothetical protein